MPEFDPRPIVPQNNTDVLHAIWQGASMDYQDRIPEPTQANIQQSIKSMWDYRPARNEFFDALANRIGLLIFMRRNWSNPLSKFKRGRLEYGDTIEEIQYGLIKAKAYDPRRDELERTLFGRHNIDVQSSFHTINRQDRYDFTMNTMLLRRAFLQNDGLFNFVNEMMGAAVTSDQHDEFLAMTHLFGEMAENDGFFNVQVGDLSAASVDSADARYMLRKVREFAATLPFLSNRYNAARMPVAANPDELELFATPAAIATLDVEALAGAFNVDRADVPFRINAIPAERFGIDGVQAILTTRDFFVVADTLLETETLNNPANLNQNYFLHHHQIVSASRFVPAVMFSTAPDDVITITDTPVTSVPDVQVLDVDGNVVTEVERGQRYNVTGNAVTTPEGGVNDAIRLTLVGATSPFSFVTNTGVLSIGIDETGSTDGTNNVIKIVATSVDDNTFTSDVDLTIYGDFTELWPINTDEPVAPAPDPEP